MTLLFDELYININSFGTFAAIVVLVLFILTFLLFSLFFHKLILIYYALLLQFIMVLYLTFFLVIVNSTNASVVFQMTRLLYTTFMFLSIVSIYTISHITNENLYPLKAFVIISSIIIITLIYISDTLILTKNIQITSYYRSIKGPLFPLLLVYTLLLGIIMIVIYFMLFQKLSSDIKKFHPIFIGIIFFTFFTNAEGILLYIYPNFSPKLYIPTMIFLFLFVFYIFAEIKETIKEREKMYRAYIYDQLTSVHTRNYILEKINEVISQKRLNNHYVVMIDIDGFKKINDTYGHMIGDRVLRTFGQLLIDINEVETLSGRLGGDEFILLFKNSQKEDVIRIINDLLNKYTYALTEINIDTLKVETGLSIGLIPIYNTMSLKDILTQADKTMYDAKKNGKNTIRILAHS